jgi:hypothetical protein
MINFDGAIDDLISDSVSKCTKSTLTNRDYAHIKDNYVLEISTGKERAKKYITKIEKIEKVCSIKIKRERVELWKKEKNLRGLK